MQEKERIFYKKEGLDAILLRIFDFPLTTVTAPMGYGKSIAVKSFLSHMNVHVIEAALFGKQVSGSYLWDKLAKEIAKLNQSLGDKLSQLGLPKDLQHVYRILHEIEPIVINTPVVVVIDDFYLLDSQEINQFIQALAYRNINKLHIVLIGRKQPDIDLIEMQIKNVCYFIGQFELMFTAKDIRGYFKMHGYMLSEDVTYKIFQNTEGWISAIYLTMLEYKETRKIEDTQPISKIIESTIYSKYDEDIKRFFLKLSVMSEFDISQALFVTEEDRASEFLKNLEETNAFITYNGISGVYRIHKLMSQFLYNKLLRQNEINKKELLRRVGDWYVQNNQLFNAFDYYLEAKEHVEILKQLTQIGTTKMIEKKPELIVHIFEKIPIETAVEYPIAYLIGVYGYIFLKEYKKAAQILEVLDKRCNESLCNENILGEIYLARCFLFIEDPVKLLECQRQAEKYLLSGSRIVDADSILNFVPSPLSFSHYTKLGAYKQYGEIYADYYERREHVIGGGREMDDLIWAEYFLETGRINKAVFRAQRAICKAEISKQKSIVIWASLCLARVYLYQNDYTKGIDMIVKLRERLLKEGDRLRLHTTETALAYLSSCFNQLEHIPQWIIQGDIFTGPISSQNNPLEYIIALIVLVLQKEFLKLEIICEEIFSYYTRQKIFLGIIYILIFEAIAKFNLYGMQEGKKSLIKALSTAAEDTIVMPFTEMGRFILPMLYEIQRESLFSEEYIGLIIQMSNVYCFHFKNDIKEKPGTPLNLSKREEEILMLMAQGMTNKEIAKELFLADITVGKTCSSIFKKLGVKGRVGAIQHLNNLTNA
jgi:LuxR family maltose regulon positive regulatory protein